MRSLLLAVLSLSTVGSVAMAAPGVQYRPGEDACRPKKVDKNGSVGQPEVCTTFEPARHLGAGWKKSEAKLRGKRLVFGSASLNPIPHNGEPVKNESHLFVGVSTGSGPVTNLFDWAPLTGVAAVNDVMLGSDDHLVAVVFTPFDASGLHPDVAQRLAAVFDITERLAAIPK